MSSKTANLNLHKIDLTDAPPDITVLNQNWDTLDEKVHNLETESANHLPLDGGVLEGALTVKENLNVNKTYNDTEYKTYIRPINYSIGNNGDYSTGLLHYKGTTNDSQLMFNKDGVMLRDNVNGKAYKLFGQHNTSDLITAVSGSGFSRVAQGSYTGTSTEEYNTGFGATETYTGKVNITFPFTPKFVVLQGGGKLGICQITGSTVTSTGIVGYNMNYYDGTTSKTFNTSTNTLTLTGGSMNGGSTAKNGFNWSGTTYSWVAIG